MVDGQVLEVVALVLHVFYSRVVGLMKSITTGMKIQWRGGLVVGRRTCDLAVVGSRPGRDAAA